MIMSMTGYGKAESSCELFDIDVELRSVNHRYFEFSVRYPRQYAFLEDKLKKLCQSRITRGKVDMFVTIVSHNTDDVDVSVNHALAKSYLDAIHELSDTYGISGDVSANALSHFPDVFTVTKADIDEDYVWEKVSATADKAIDAFLEMRIAEGEKMKEDVLSKAKTIIGYVEQIEAKSPQTVRDYRDRLEAKMRELLGNAEVDEQRLLTETAIFADKVAVDEETVRLRSHFKQMSDMFDSGKPIGRSLDFLVQEMNREANTIGSKCQDVEISHIVVAIKSEIEKIREQVQNIE